MCTSLWVRPVIAAVVLGSWLLGDGLHRAFAHADHVETEQIQLQELHPDQATLEAAFIQAAAQYQVPVEILRAVGFVESRWVHTGPTIDYGYGIMHLVNNTDSQTLIEAAKATGYTAEQLMTDPIANIHGGAAVIAKYAVDTVGQPQAIEDYYAALKLFSGLNPEVQSKQAHAYYAALADGVSAENNLGMQIELPAVDVDMAVIGPENDGPIVESTDYGPAIWNPAASCNYETTRLASIDRWINHWVGSGSYAGTISWFKNCAASTSSHFVIRQSDGEITQMVRIAHKAWTTGYMNSRSIGVEHEATPSYPWPQNANAPMIVASATACRYFCNLYGMPKTRTYITGHSDYYSTACPGNLPWDVYLAVVNGGGGPCDGSDGASGTDESWPYDGDTVNTNQVFNKSWTVQNTGTSTWTRACNFKWAFDGGTQFGAPAWTELGTSESIAPGQSKTWTMTLTAPSTPGSYQGYFIMDRYGTGRFGVRVWILVNVVATTGNLTGTVTNASTSATISGATVTLPGKGNTTTNGSGVYTFNSVTAGNYTASVSATGYNPGSSGVTITAGNTTTKNFALTPSDTQAPTIPTNLNATAPAYNKVQLTWTASTDNVGVTGYDIRRGGAIIGSSATASYTDNSVTQNTTYTYEVRAKDSVPNYSEWSDPAQVTTPYAAPVSTVVFSDGFNGNLNNWTQGSSAYAYATTTNHGTFTGGGAAYMAAGEADQMHHSFARPFAQGKVKGYYWDGKGGWQTGVCGWAYRQSMSLRDADMAAKMYIDNEFYSASDNTKYFYRLIGVGSGGAHTAYATRDPGTDCNGAWVAFETTVTPGAPNASPTGTFIAKVTDRAGTTSTTQNLTTDYFAWGFARITLGLGNSSANEGYWDDISLEATPPGVPTMNAPTVLSDTQIRWNFTPADNNHFGWDLMDDGGTVVSPNWPNAGWLNHNATSWTQSGLTANTTYSRKVKSWNGTLNSYDSSVVSARTLSPAPGAGSVTPDNASPCAWDDVIWTAVGGFGGAGKVEYYAYAWDTNPTYSFSGDEPTWDSDTLVLPTTTPGTWYLHLKGYNADDVANGVFNYSVTAAACSGPPAATAAVSRKIQGGSPFDIDVAVTTAVECRSGGPTQVVVTFDAAIEGQGGLDNADVSVSSGSVDGVSITGSELTVTLSSVANAAKLVMTFPGIVAVGGDTAGSSTVCFGVLTGDATGDGLTNIFDLVTIRNNLNATVNAGNFRNDVTVDGSINIFDLVLVRNNLNLSVTESCP